MPLVIYEGLSYPSHFLKIGNIVASGIIFTKAESNKSTYLRNTLFFILVGSPFHGKILLMAKWGRSWHPC